MSKLAYIVIFITILLSITSVFTPISVSEENVGYETGETIVFEMNDPVGDDDGIGTLIYPTEQVFQEGVFDLVKFTISTDTDYIYFRATFRNLGGNPWNAKNGFCLQYVQIYILTTNNTLPTSNASYGLNITIYYKWHYAILVNGGWETEPLPMGELPAIYDANNNLISVENGVLYDVYVDQNTPNTIVAKVNRTLLVDTENMHDWKIVVAVASYDGYGPMRVRPIREESEKWVFGGGDPNAILAGVHPGVIDLLATTAEDQYEMLRNWNIDEKIPPLVGSIVISTRELVKPPLISPPTTPPVTTPTPTPSPTPTPTPTPSPRPTPSPTPSPTPTPSLSPTPAPERLPGSLVAVLVLVIIIIIVILLFLLRKPSPKPK